MWVRLEPVARIAPRAREGFKRGGYNARHFAGQDKMYAVAARRPAQVVLQYQVPCQRSPPDAGLEGFSES